MKPALVIFDCDGVIVDSEGQTCIAIANSLTRYGMTITADQIHDQFLGGTLFDIRDRARADGFDLPDDWVREVYAEMFDLLDQGVALSSGVVDLFDALEAQGTKIAIASNGAMDKMRHTLGPHGLFDRFDGWIWSGHTSKSPKPEPGMLISAMQKAGATPETTVMIDDSPAGAGAAEAAGTRFYGYSEHTPAEKLAQTGAEIVRSMAELKTRLIA